LEPLSERIASISLPTVLILLIVLTAARLVLGATRVAVLRAIGELFESLILAIALVFLVLRPLVVQSFFIPSGSMHPTLMEGDHILVNKLVYRFQEPKRGEVLVFRAPREAAPDEKEFIKRLIGIPGDTIEVRAGYVLVGNTVFTRNEIRAALGEDFSVDEMEDKQAELPPLRLMTDAIYLGERRILPEEFANLVGKPGSVVQIQPGRVFRNGTMLMEGYVAEDAQYQMSPRLVPPGQYFVMGDNRNLSHDSHVWGMLPQDRVIGRADFVFWPMSHARHIDTKVPE
jgi:signal peptidase I